MGYIWDLFSVPQPTIWLAFYKCHALDGLDGDGCPCLVACLRMLSDLVARSVMDELLEHGLGSSLCVLAWI